MCTVTREVKQIIVLVVIEANSVASACVIAGATIQTTVKQTGDFWPGLLLGPLQIDNARFIKERNG